MRNFDIQGIALDVPIDKAFTFIADRNNLPIWTNAFFSVSAGKAVMETSKGRVEIGLSVNASSTDGVIDWSMTFPDYSIVSAYSRIVAAKVDRCIYSVILMPPPVALEEIEGALGAQSLILNEELKKLKGLLEENG